MVNPMTRVSPGVYQRDDGAFFARITLAGRRTWRKLRAVKLRAAIKEAANADWSAPAGTFSEIADLYLAASCPNRRLEPRVAFINSERARIIRLKSFFGRLPAASIRLAHLPGYHAWRTRPSKLRYGSGDRATDKDLCTLSNVLNYGVASGILELNWIARGRPRYRVATAVRRSREVAPDSAATIHRIAAEFLSTPRSEVFAWLAFFSAFTGCRTSELLRLRLDAKTRFEPGYIEGNMLFLGRRSKSGVNPWARLGDEFSGMLDAFRHWHAATFPRNPWFFPSPYGKTARLSPGAFGHALTRICGGLELPHITPHGFRSYYVTKRRSDGASDVQIAAEIGDKTVSLMQLSYGDRPENWLGAKPMTWLPADGLPAWQAWLAASPDKMDYGMDYGRSAENKTPVQQPERVVAGDGIEPPTQGFSVPSNQMR